MTTAISGKIHITHNKKVITDPLDPLEPRGYNLYLFNMTEEEGCHAYVGGDDIKVGEGIVIPSGSLSRAPIVINVRPDAILFAIAVAGKDCRLGFMKMV
jgi:hypothetical protein